MSHTVTYDRDGVALLDNNIESSTNDSDHNDEPQRHHLNSQHQHKWLHRQPFVQSPSYDYTQRWGGRWVGARNATRFEPLTFVVSEMTGVRYHGISCSRSLVLLWGLSSSSLDPESVPLLRADALCETQTA